MAAVPLDPSSGTRARSTHLGAAGGLILCTWNVGDGPGKQFHMAAARQRLESMVEVITSVVEEGRPAVIGLQEFNSFFIPNLVLELKKRGRLKLAQGVGDMYTRAGDARPILYTADALELVELHVLRHALPAQSPTRSGGGGEPMVEVAPCARFKLKALGIHIQVLNVHIPCHGGENGVNREACQEAVFNWLAPSSDLSEVRFVLGDFNEDLREVFPPRHEHDSKKQKTRRWDGQRDTPPWGMRAASLLQDLETGSWKHGSYHNRLESELTNTGRIIDWIIQATPRRPRVPHPSSGQRGEVRGPVCTQEWAGLVVPEYWRPPANSDDWQRSLSKCLEAERKHTLDPKAYPGDHFAIGCRVRLPEAVRSR